VIAKTDIKYSPTNFAMRYKAIEKLTDQELLADIAKNVKDFMLRELAIEQLTDQTLLAKIALEGPGGDIALEKLASQKDLYKIPLVDMDKRLQLVTKFISAFQSKPGTGRMDLMKGLLPAIRVFSNPSVVNEVGEIIEIKTEWRGTSEFYIGTLTGSKPGEIFTVTIKVQKLPEPISYTWATSFPQTVSNLSFLSASINPADMIKILFEKIKDQDLLADIARNDKDEDVREVARLRLEALQEK
jgi:hypothetical protein